MESEELRIEESPTLILFQHLVVIMAIGNLKEYKELTNVFVIQQNKSLHRMKIW